jgi:hypothetical protein
MHIGQIELPRHFLEFFRPGNLRGRDLAGNWVVPVGTLRDELVSHEGHVATDSREHAGRGFHALGHAARASAITALVVLRVQIAGRIWIWSESGRVDLLELVFWHPLATARAPAETLIAQFLGDQIVEPLVVILHGVCQVLLRGSDSSLLSFQLLAIDHEIGELCQHLAGGLRELCVGEPVELGQDLRSGFDFRACIRDGRGSCHDTLLDSDVGTTLRVVCANRDYVKILLCQAGCCTDSGGNKRKRRRLLSRTDVSTIDCALSRLIAGVGTPLVRGIGPMAFARRGGRAAF